MSYSAIPVDVLTDFEVGAHADPINAAYFTNATHGAVDGWWLEYPDTGDWTVSTNASYSFPGGFLCDGTNYSGGTRGAKVEVNDSFFWNVSVPFQSVVSGGCFFLFDPPPEALNIGYDLLMISVSGGQSGTAQWRNDEPPFLHAHNGGVPPIAYVTRGASYWLTWKFTSGEDFRFRIYDPNTWTQVGDECTNVIGVGTMDTLSLGMNSHGTPGSERLYFDNVVIDWTNATYPIVPAQDGGSLTFTVLTQPTKGVLSGTAPNLTFTPTLNATGADSFTFKVNDGVADSPTATVSLSITPVNDIPVANAKSVVLLEDIVTPIVLTGSDVEGSPLTFTVLTQPAKGVLSGTAPNLVYTPTLNATGADSFTFKVNDGVADSTTKTVLITITPVVDIPVADAKSVVLLEDVVTPIVLTGSGGDGPRTFTVLTQPTKGVLSGTAPNLVYTPTLDATGADSFTFKVTSSAVDSTTKTVSITITPVVDPPTANPKTVVLLEDIVTPIVLTGSA